MLESLMLAAAVGATSLEASFTGEMPNSAKPHTWYHMMNGNVTKAGITRDFEELAKAGVGGVQMFDAGCNIPPGGLDFNSPEWFDMFKHAASEARRLGLEICIPNCSGWSSSGGPWNMPSNGMKKVSYSETRANGPSKFDAVLERIRNDHGFYSDIAVLAFPTPKPELEKFEKVKSEVDGPGFTLSSTEPFEISGFQYRLATSWIWNNDATMSIEISDDGTNYGEPRKVKVPIARQAARDETLRFMPLSEKRKVRAVRVRLECSDPVKVAEARPTLAAWVPEIGAKTFAMRLDPLKIDYATDPSQIVDSKKVVDLTDRLDASGRLKWDVPAGDWTILRIGYSCNGRENHPASDHGKGLEVDKLSAEAMDYHFEQYVGRLCRTLGPLAGAVETGFNNILVDSYEVGSQNWTQKMESEFARRRGYSLRRFLPAFSGRVVDSLAETERFLEDFRRTVADLFAENYCGALTRKCRQYGLMSSVEPYGNCPSDDLQYGEYCDIPMCEFWSNASNPFTTTCGNTKHAASIAHVWGKKYCASESFTANEHSGRWRATPFSIKAQCDNAYAHGVNRIIYHRFVHQPWADDKYLPGMTMGKWGMHFDRTQTWWPMVGPFLKYQARCQAMLQRGVFCADVLWFAGEQAPNSGGDVKDAPRGDFRAPEGYDYDCCPVDALMKLTVKNGRIVAPGGVRYRILALPELDAVSPAVMEKLVELRKAGAEIYWRRKPVRAPGLSFGPDADKRVAKLADALWKLGVRSSEIGDALRKAGAEPDVLVISALTAKDTGEFEWIHRRENGADWYFTALPARKPVAVEVSFRQTGRVPEIWDAEHGTIRRAREWREENGRTIVKVRYSTSGSAFVVFRDGDAAKSLMLEEPDKVRKSIAVDGAWKVRFPNSYLPNALASGEEEVVDFPKLSDWKDSDNEGVRYFSGIATYVKLVEFPAADLAGSRRIVLDLGNVKHLAEVKVNGKSYPALWKPPFRVDITDAVKGPFKLEVRVANQWANRLIGDDTKFEPDCEWKIPANKNPREIGIKEIPQWVKDGKPSPTGRHTFTTWKHWDKNDKLQSSGLLGPVKIDFMEK